MDAEATSEGVMGRVLVVCFIVPQDKSESKH